MTARRHLRVVQPADPPLAQRVRRAVIYARVSDEHQVEKGLSVDSQIEACRRKAEELGAVVVQICRDDGISGTTTERPGFQAAVGLCVAKGIEFFICWSSSRLARNLLDAAQTKQRLASAGTKVVYASSAIDIATDDGWLLDAVLQVIDERQSRQIGTDTRRSMASAAREGFFMGGRVPFGYEAVPVPGSKRRRLQPHPAEREVVVSIFEHARRGLGAKSIAVALSRDGFTLRGRPWTKNTILNLLHSEVYVGQVVFGRVDRRTRTARPESEWTRIQAHEAIVEREVWDEVQRALFGREPIERQDAPFVPANNKHWFAGLLRCGACGAGMKLTTGQGRNGTTYHYYTCNSRVQGKTCDSKPLPADKVDAWLLSELLERVITVEAFASFRDTKHDHIAEYLKQRDARRRALVGAVRDAERRRANIWQVIEAGGAQAPGVAELGPRLKQLNDELNRLEAALVALESEDLPAEPDGSEDVPLEDLVAALREMIASTTDPMRIRGFLGDLVQEVRIDAEQASIVYRPEMLVPVHSERGWLPVLGLQRTATLVCAMPDRLGRRAVAA